jgi:hypothetical protein
MRMMDKLGMVIKCRSLGLLQYKKGVFIFKHSDVRQVLFSVVRMSFCSFIIFFYFLTNSVTIMSTNQLFVDKYVYAGLLLFSLNNGFMMNLLN